MAQLLYTNATHPGEISPMSRNILGCQNWDVGVSGILWVETTAAAKIL